MSRLWLTNWLTWESRAVFCLSSVKYGGSECLSLYCEQISEVTKIEFFYTTRIWKKKNLLYFRFCKRVKLFFSLLFFFTHCSCLEVNYMSELGLCLTVSLQHKKPTKSVSSSSNVFLFNPASFFSTTPFPQKLLWHQSAKCFIAQVHHTPHLWFADSGQEKAAENCWKD